MKNLIIAILSSILFYTQFCEVKMPFIIPCMIFAFWLFLIWVDDVVHEYQVKIRRGKYLNGKIKRLLPIIVLFLVIFRTPVQAMTDEVKYNPLYKQVEEPKVNCYFMQATAYCINGRTASGENTRVGIVASKPEWIGKTMAVYLRGKDGKAGQFLGYFEVKDTGGSSIRNGNVIDLWLPTYEECMAFGRKEVVVFLIDGVDG